MLGGLLSAVFVGTIVDKKDLYATIVADSYAQSSDNDEEFWKGLSEEEKIKTQEFLSKMQSNKNNGDNAIAEQKPVVVAATTESKPSNAAAKDTSTTIAAAEEKKPATAEVGMFSDYADEWMNWNIELIIYEWMIRRRGKIEIYYKNYKEKSFYAHSRMYLPSFYLSNAGGGGGGYYYLFINYTLGSLVRNS